MVKSLDAWRYEKAQRIVAFLESRGVLVQAQTYSDAEWREAGIEAGEGELSQIVIAIARNSVEEKFKDPFRGLL